VDDLTLKTRETCIELPGLALLFNLVEDVEALITDPGDEDKIPLWAEIWPAARGLALYIWENMRFEGQQVLDLGSGLGLSGVVCGLRGAGVTFSDYQREALDFCICNARLNGLTGVETYLGDWRSFGLKKKYNWIVGSDILYDPKFHRFLAEIFKNNTVGGGGILISHPGRSQTFDFVKEWQRENPCLEEHTVIPVQIEDPYFPYYEIHIHKLVKTV